MHGLTTAESLAPQAQKVPNLITFFGNRKAWADEDAISNCVAA